MEPPYIPDFEFNFVLEFFSYFVLQIGAMDAVDFLVFVTQDRRFIINLEGYIQIIYTHIQH